MVYFPFFFPFFLPSPSSVNFLNLFSRKLFNGWPQKPRREDPTENEIAVCAIKSIVKILIIISQVGCNSISIKLPENRVELELSLRREMLAADWKLLHKNAATSLLPDAAISFGNNSRMMLEQFSIAN